MPYVTSVEKIGIKKGMQQGMQQGMQRGMQQGIQQGMLLEAREMLIEVLTERFGKINNRISEQLEHINSRETLKHLLRQALQAKSLNKFEEGLFVD